MNKLIFLQDLDLKGSPMVRSELRDDVINDYAEIYKDEPKRLPPLEVFSEDGRHIIIADGMHRVAALRKLGQKTAIANVHKGNFEEALMFALLANERHGLRRSPADKRRSVKEAIKQWPKYPDVQIAKLCAVDNHTVKAVRDELEKKGEVKEEPIRENSEGRKHPARIGKQSSGNSQITKETGKPRKLEEKDGTGFVIPAHAMQYWVRIPEVKELLSKVSEISRFLRNASREQDVMYAEVNFTAAEADIDRLVTNLATAMPHAVCTQCQGQPRSQPRGECRLCKGRGLISKFRWNSVPPEVRKMREKT